MAGPRLSVAGTLRALRTVPSRRPLSSSFSHPPRPVRPAPATTTTTTRPLLSTTPLLPTSHESKRALHTTPPTHSSSSSSSKKPALGHNKEPVPATPPPTDFGELDVLASAPVPATAVEVCHADGFSLNSGVRIGGGDGALLVGGEAFVWRPWEAGDGDGRRGKMGGRRLVNDKGQWEVAEEVWGALGLLWPRPDLLILGLGPEIRPLSPATRRAISNLGMRVEVLDTRNAASQYNMLATERGVEDVAAALIPIGWKEGTE